MNLFSEHLLYQKNGEGKKQLLIAKGGIHGYEIAGIKDMDSVFSLLSETEKPFCGNFNGLAGNILALKQETRFVKSDLNRIWTEENLAFIENEFNETEYPEHSQLKGLTKIINHYLGQGFEEIAIIDLQTTSANGGVFIVCPNNETHKKMLRRLHVPVILNLDKDLDGTAMQYFWQKNILAFAFEGGNHFSPDSIDKMESALWLCLEYMGCGDRYIFDNIEYHDLRLIHATEDLPHFCKMFYHHKIQEGDHFEMEPGFSNFQQLKKGDLLANDKNGRIYCPEDCYILMPLYQKQGSDGFFLIEKTT